MKDNVKESCQNCDNYEYLGEGFGLCKMDAIPVTVTADYQPTKNYLRCKTAYYMQSKGWCDDCAEDINTCIKQGKCEGHRRYDENTK